VERRWSVGAAPAITTAADPFGRAFSVLIGRDYRDGAVRRMGSAPLSIVARDAAVFYGPFGLSAGRVYGPAAAVVKSSPSTQSSPAGVEAGAALAGYVPAFSGLGQIRRWSQVMTPREVLSTIDSRYLERRSPARPIAAAIPTQ
jgi:hypothetical protein